MIKNNLEIDVKVKCLEEGVTQAQLAQMGRGKGLLKNEQRKTQRIYGCDIGDHHDNIGAGT